MFKLTNEEGTITLEPITFEDAVNDYSDYAIVTEEVGEIIQGLLDKNRRLATKLAGNAKFITSQMKPALHLAYMEGARAKEDVLFAEKELGETVELPMPYAP